MLPCLKRQFYKLLKLFRARSLSIQKVPKQVLRGYYAAVPGVIMDGERGPLTEAGMPLTIVTITLDFGL